MPTVKFPYTQSGQRKAKQAASQYGGNVEQYDSDVYRTQGGGGQLGITGATGNYDVPTSSYQELPEYQPPNIYDPISTSPTAPTGGQTQYGGYGPGSTDVGLPPDWMTGEGSSPWSANYLDYIAPTLTEGINWNEPLGGVYEFMFPAGEYGPSDWQDFMIGDTLFNTVGNSNLGIDYEDYDFAGHEGGYEEWWYAQNTPVLFGANNWQYPTLGGWEYGEEAYGSFNPELLQFLSQGGPSDPQGYDPTEAFDPSAEPAFWEFLGPQMGGAEWGWGPGQYNWSNMSQTNEFGQESGWWSGLLELMGFESGGGWNYDSNQTEQFMGYDIWNSPDVPLEEYGQDIIPSVSPRVR